MARTPTAGMTAKLDQKLGTEPIMVLRINWPSGVQYYADKAFVVGAVQVLGKIQTVNNLSVVRYQDSYGAIGGFSVSMDDADKHFYTIMNQTILEGVTVQIYHYYPGLASTDLFSLFAGKISTPINWNESEHVLSFDVINTFDQNNAGEYLPAPADWVTPNHIYPIRDEFEGVFPPIIFGSCLYVPCPKLQIAGESQTTQQIHFEEDKGARTPSVLIREGEGDKFPSGSLKVMIDNVRFTGGFSASNPDKFIISKYNDTVDLGSAETYRVEEDADFENFSVVWIRTREVLKNNWVLFWDTDNGYYANFCIDQEGEKFYFKQPFARNIPDYEDENGPFLFRPNQSTALQYAGKYNIDWPEWASGVWESEVWDIATGSTFIEILEPIYIVNYIPGTVIKGVYAYRDVKDYLFDPETGAYVDQSTRRQLCKVPSSYYTKNTVKFINGKPMTTLTLRKPLSQYIGESWDDAIFVTMASPIGPNTSDIIKWILQNFTTISIDTTSFNAVRTKIADYPSCFGVFDQKKALQLCQQIAWQARCGLTIYSNTAYLTYLSEEPTSVKTLDSSMIQYKSIDISFSNLEEMYTRIKATYKRDYVDTKERSLIYSNNIAQYGMHETTWDFFIYNYAPYVRKSLQFWGNRYSNSWKKLKFTSFLNTLNLDLFDCVTLDFATTYPLGITTIKSIIEEWSYNSDSKLVNIALCTAMKAGTIVAAPSFWLDDAGDGISAKDLTAYATEEDYKIPTVSNKLSSNEAVDAIITDAYPEEIDEVETGKTLYDIESYPYGFENLDTEEHEGVRTLDPDEIYTIGDKVQISHHLGKTYIRRSVDIVKYIIVSEEDDYLVCHTWNDKTQEAGSANVKVAKPYLLRRTPFDGESRGSVSYDYSAPDVRTASMAGEDDIEEMITPSYLAGDIIKVCSPLHGTGVFVDEVDIGLEEKEGGRLWCEMDPVE